MTVSTLTGLPRQHRSRAVAAAWVAGTVSLFTSAIYAGSGLSVTPLHYAAMATAVLFLFLAVAGFRASRRAQARKARTVHATPTLEDVLPDASTTR